MCSSQRGFGIIDMIIAAGLMGMLATGLVALQRNGAQSQKAMLAKDDSQLLTNDMLSLLTDGTACLNTFGGQNPVTGAVITKVMDTTGNPKYQTGVVYGNRSISILSITVGGAGIDGKTNIQKWQQTSAGPPIKGTALVLVNWQKNVGANGAKQLIQFFLLDTTLASGLISACVANVAASITASGGSGTENRLPEWVDATKLGDSSLFQSGTNIGIGTTIPNDSLQINGGITLKGMGDNTFAMKNLGVNGGNWGITNRAGAGDAGGLAFNNMGSVPAEAMRISNTGHIGIGTDTPVLPLEVQGAVRFKKYASPPYVCGSTFTGTIATTSVNTLCACNGTKWVMVSDGSTACNWVTGLKSCTMPWGEVISSGDSRLAYLTSSGTCASETRKCTNGTLSGAFTFKDCTAGCTVSPGTETITTAGTSMIPIPCYNTLTVAVNGAGGGGGAGILGFGGGRSPSGNPGEDSSFGSVSPVQGYGGKGGGGCSGGGPGAPGAASGGDTNTSGGGSAGGKGGLVCGAKGGNGGKAVKVWTPATGPAPSSVISISIGNGGAGGNNGRTNGSPGAMGSVQLIWK